MREIKILTLSLRNFKGCEALTLEFDGQSASIYGDNATGKTTIYDALTWLLFGKDSRGRGDFEIKPLGPDNKVKDHAAVTSVEAALLTDGIETRLKRPTLKSGPQSAEVPQKPMTATQANILWMRFQSKNMNLSSVSDRSWTKSCFGS